LSAKLSSKTRGIISAVLSSACAAWLRTLVSEVSELRVEIIAGDRQMLAGTIPAVAVIAQRAVYRGVAVQDIDLLAEEIAINLNQVVRGKPLRLLQPITVAATVLMTSEDLHKSLTAPFLSKALTDLVKQILASTDQAWSIEWQSAAIQASQVLLQGQVQQSNHQSPITIQTGIEVVNGRMLRFFPLTVSCALDLPGSELSAYEIDLGSHVNLQELALAEGKLRCKGEIQVSP
jgi:LmeA-like phospholipid-binding